MQISIFAVGRMKKGPEQELVSRYFDRFSEQLYRAATILSGHPYHRV